MQLGEAARVQPAKRNSIIPPRPIPPRIKFDHTAHSYVGPKFVQYWTAKGADPWAMLPVVEIAVKVAKVVSINFRENVFACELLLLLSWDDVSVEGTARFDPADHFFPVVVVENAVRLETPSDLSVPKRLKKKEFDKGAPAMRLTQTIKGQFKAEVDLTKYPFDRHFLQVVFSSKYVLCDAPLEKTSKYCTVAYLNNPNNPNNPHNPHNPPNNLITLITLITLTTLI
jgi:hypothetical protein